MRILFILPSLYGGGAERVASIWSSELAKTDIEVHLLVFYRTENEYGIHAKVNIHSFCNEKSEYDSYSKLKKLTLMRQTLKEIKPEIVMPFITYIGIMVSLSKIGLHIKIYETIRNNPWCIPQNRIIRWIRNISILNSKLCIVQTQSQLSYFPAWLQKRIVVISNPIQRSFTERQKEWNNKIQNIVAVGRLEKQKNYPLLINAFNTISQEFNDVHLNIYGEGSLKNELIELINHLNLQERVSLCGRNHNILAALLDSDLYILSSDYEGMPNALMEAMAIGLPCISTNCLTGPSDLIKNGTNGILIPVGDMNALVNAMKTIIKNINKTKFIGRNARELILSKYKINNCSEKLLGVFMGNVKC